MGETEIIKFIRSGISRGLDLIEIKQSMFARGWSDYDISKALRDSGIESEEKERSKKIEREEKIIEDNSIENWDAKK